MKRFRTHQKEQKAPKAPKAQKAQQRNEAKAQKANKRRKINNTLKKHPREKKSLIRLFAFLCL